MSLHTRRPCALRALGLAAGALAVPAFGQVIFTVNPGGPSGLLSSGIYSATSGTPTLVGGVGGSGLNDGADDLNAVSRRHTSTRFVICESIDPTSVGAAQGPPALGLPPFNAHDQALKNQAAGDVFRTSKAYDRATGLDPGASMPQNENYLIINQGKQYPQNFGLNPAADPATSVASGTPQDDVDGLIRGTGLLDRAFSGLYFSITATSPSLGSLGGTSAADVFYDPDPTSGGNESMFATFAMLGLVPADTIDGLMVWDDNSNGLFDATDSVIFSLAPGSPTLGFFGLGGADILKAEIGFLGLFALHSDYALLATDNIDALEEVPLINNSAYETLLSDVPAPGTATLFVFGAVTLARRRR